jgi:predicted benzoate:H+ symporter BenE
LAASFLLIFGVFNALVFLSVQQAGKYWSQSIFSYAGFALLGGLCAMFFSGVSLSEAGSFRWIYLVITFSYLIFLSIGGFMKAIVHVAQKADTRNFDNKRYKHK